MGTVETRLDRLRYAVAKGHIESNPLADTRPSDFLRSHTVTNFARIEDDQFPDEQNAVSSASENMHKLFIINSLQ